MVVIFLKEPLVFLSDIFQEVLTIGSTCIFINHKEVLVCHTWDITGHNSQSFMALIFINQFLYRLGLLLRFLALLLSGHLDWYFFSLLYLGDIDEDESVLVGVLLVGFSLLLGVTIFLFNGNSLSVVFVHDFIGYGEESDFVLDLFKFGVVVFNWESIGDNVNDVVVDGVHHLFKTSVVHGNLVLDEEGSELDDIIIGESGKIVVFDLEIVQELPAFWVQKDVDGLGLHVLQVLHEEWNQMLLKQKLSWVVGLHEIILIIVEDSLLHIILEALRVLLHDLLENIVDLGEVTSKGSNKFALLIMPMDILEIGLEDVRDLAFEDNISLNLLSEFFTGLVHFSLLSSFSPLLFPYLILFLGFLLVLCSLPVGLIFGLDSGSVGVLGIKNTINNYFLRTFVSCLVLHKKVLNFGHEPRDNLLLNSSVLRSNEDTLAGELAERLLPEAREVVLGQSSRVELLVSVLLLELSCLVLDISPGNLLLASLLGGFVSLSNDEFSIDNLFILLLL